MKEQKNIALRAGFVGLKFLPHPLVVGSNNLNPKLVLRKDDFEYRGLFLSKIRRYTDIDIVDVYVNAYPIIATSTIILEFKDSPFVFSGSLSQGEMLRDLVLFFQDRGCSLSKRAEDFLNF